MRVHLDTDFLVFALSHSGPERQRLRELVDSDTEIQISRLLTRNSRDFAGIPELGLEGPCEASSAG